MKMWIALLLIFSIELSRAADPVATLTDLRAALREELKSALDKGNIENNQRLFQLESLLVESLPDKELPDEKMPQTIQALLQVRAISRDKKVNELADKLVDELHTESRAAAKRLQESFSVTLARCLREGFKATKPSELDAPLKEMADLKRRLSAMQNRNLDSRTGVQSQGLQSIEGLLTAYQDLLFAAEKGTPPASSAQRLASEYSYRDLHDIIPRSEFLELVNAATSRLPKKGQKPNALSAEEFDRKLQEAIDQVTTMEDLGVALKRVMEVIETQEKATGGTYNGGVTAPIKKMNKIHADILAGFGTSVDVSLLTLRDEGDRTEKIKSVLLRFVLPRLLDVEGDNAIRDHEALPPFLARTAAGALEKRNWVLLAKALDLAQRLPSGSSPFSTAESSALRQFLTALNMERARQYPAAVSAYHAALKTGSQNIPLDFIGERLASIEKEHPKEFQAGIELSNVPTIERSIPAGVRMVTPYVGPLGYRPDASSVIQIPPTNFDAVPTKSPPSPNENPGNASKLPPSKSAEPAVGKK